MLQLADLIGGDWPSCARRALVNIYTSSDEQEAGFFGELLRDMRDAFVSKGDPSFLPTGYTLNYLRAGPWNTWRADGQPMEAVDLAGLLHIKGISSCNQRFGLNVIKGYRRKDFLKWWRRLPKSNSARLTRQQ